MKTDNAIRDSPLPPAIPVETRKEVDFRLFELAEFLPDGFFPDGIQLVMEGF